jgi:hypothetical protein
VNAPSLRKWLAVLSFACAAGALAASSPAPRSSAPKEEQRPTLLLQIGAGVVAAAVTAPVSVWLGQWVGSWTGSDLAALPALLLAVAVPPLAVTFSGWLAGNWGGPERYHLTPALWVTAGVSVATFVVAGLLGLNANEPGRLAAYTAADAVLLPAAAVTTFQLTAAPSPVSLSPGEPRLPRLASMPVVRIQF